MARQIAIGLALISLVFSMNHLTHGSEGGTSYHDTIYPDSGWNISSPAEQRINATKLEEIEQYLGEDPQIDSILIIRNGYLVYEEYPSGEYSATQLHFLASCTKSVISALIGIAIDLGLIESVDAKVLSFFPNHTIQNVDSRKEALTIRHLLTMTAGFDWDEWTFPYGDPKNTLTQMYASGNNVQFVLDMPMRSYPGEEWVYCSGASHLLSAIIAQTSEMSTYKFAKQYLFEPIGILDAYWLVDSQGVHLGGGGLSLSPSDMARFGYLYLNEGRWKSEQIVPKEWVLQSLEVIVDLGGCDGYSYQWWNVPALGVTHASGLYGQRICVIPAYNMVVVFTADMEDQMVEIDILTNCIIPAVLTDSPSLERFACAPVLALLLAPLFISYVIYQDEMKKFQGGTLHD